MLSLCPFWHFWWCRGFCHRTGSDLLLFVLPQKATCLGTALVWELFAGQYNYALILICLVIIIYFRSTLKIHQLYIPICFVAFSSRAAVAWDYRNFWQRTPSEQLPFQNLKPAILHSLNHISITFLEMRFLLGTYQLIIINLNLKIWIKQRQ